MGAAGKSPDGAAKHLSRIAPFLCADNRASHEPGNSWDGAQRSLGSLSISTIRRMAWKGNSWTKPS
jgi:hypothetical protein